MDWIEPYFNTSHVTVYLIPPQLTAGSVGISIHLMLLFILWTPCRNAPDLYISIHLMLLFIGILGYSHSRLNHFNTSHVTVYLSSVHLNFP